MAQPYSSLHLRLARWVVARSVRRAARETLEGRPVDLEHPERGRLLRRDVDLFLERTWRNLDALLPEARLEELPTRGSRLNVLLAALTVAAYHALLEAGIARDQAIRLFSDVGWKVYVGMLTVPRWLARLRTRDPQGQMNFMLRLFLRYPFAAPGRPGYEVRVWEEPDHLCTFWTHCPPQSFVRRYVETHGDRGEMEAFRRSWCAYDGPLTRAMVEGVPGADGHYERPHTLSAGDAVCDMRWYAKAPPHAPHAGEEAPG